MKSKLLHGESENTLWRHMSPAVGVSSGAEYYIKSVHLNTISLQRLRVWVMKTLSYFPHIALICLDKIFDCLLKRQNWNSGMQRKAWFSGWASNHTKCENQCRRLQTRPQAQICSEQETAFHNWILDIPVRWVRGVSRRNLFREQPGYIVNTYLKLKSVGSEKNMTALGSITGFTPRPTPPESALAVGSAGSEQTISVAVM